MTNKKLLVSTFFVVALLAGLVGQPAEAAYPCSVFRTWNVGDDLTAADMNSTVTTLGVTNMIPTCLDNSSHTAGAMAAVTDPYPSSSESLPTDLDGELKRLRYIVKKVSGYADWYKHTTFVAISNINFTANGDFEQWDAGTTVTPTAWIDHGTNMTVAKDTSNFKHATASAAVTRVDNDCYLGQDVVLLTNFGPIAWWRNKTVTVGAWVRATVASRARIGLNDDNVALNTTWSSYHTGSSSFEFLTVTRTIANGATQVEIRLAVDTGNTTAQFDGVILSQGATVSDFIPSSGVPTTATSTTGISSFTALDIQTDPEYPTGSFSKVQLVHADQVILEDGTRVSSPNQLSADISTSGAGGLDTGSRTASTWYELYLIAKTDGTTNLMFHQARDFFLAESYTTGEDTQYLLRRNSAAGPGTSSRNNKLAQSFKVNAVGTGAYFAVRYVDIKALRGGSPAGRVWFTIETDNAGVPFTAPAGAQIVATSEKYDPSQVTAVAGGQFYRFSFPQRVVLTSNTLYWLVLQGDYAVSDATNFQWRADLAGATYANGSKATCDGAAGACTTWTVDTGSDFTFKMYVDRSASVTMPAGYTLKGLISYAYNDSGNSLIQYRQRDRRIEYLNPQNVVSAGTVTVPTQIDLATQVPASARDVKARLLMNASGQGESVDLQYRATIAATGSFYTAQAAVPFAFSPGTGDSSFSITNIRMTNEIDFFNADLNLYYFTTLTSGGAASATLDVRGFTF